MLSVKSLGLPANWPEMLVILLQLSANLLGSITDLFERLIATVVGKRFLRFS